MVLKDLFNNTPHYGVRKNYPQFTCGTDIQKIFFINKIIIIEHFIDEVKHLSMQRFIAIRISFVTVMVPPLSFSLRNIHNPHEREGINAPPSRYSVKYDTKLPNFLTGIFQPFFDGVKNHCGSPAP